MQYSVELGRAGYVDGGDGAQPAVAAPEKLRRLLAFQEGWRRLSFDPPSLERFISESIYELAGGTFVICSAGNSKHLEAIQFTSNFADVPKRRWKFPDLELDRRVDDIGIDPASDLLVIIEQRDHALYVSSPLISQPSAHY